MSKTWLIYRKGRVLGPWSRDQIRQGLSAGTLDPFDKVSAEGSPIRHHLLDVEEIRSPTAHGGSADDPRGTLIGGLSATTLPNPSHTVAPGSPTVAAAPLRRATDFVAPVGQMAVQSQVPPAAQAANNLYQAPQQAPHSARQAVPHGTPHSPSARSSGPRASRPAARRQGTPQPVAGRSAQQKKYFLVDKRNRIVGPMSVLDIESMYFRGLLGKDVKVRKNRANLAIPVGKFLSAYARARLVPGGRSRRAAYALGQLGHTGIRMIRRSQNLTWIAVLLTILSMGGAFYAHDRLSGGEGMAKLRRYFGGREKVTTIQKRARVDRPKMRLTLQRKEALKLQRSKAAKAAKAVRAAKSAESAESAESAKSAKSAKAARAAKAAKAAVRKSRAAAVKKAAQPQARPARRQAAKLLPRPRPPRRAPANRPARPGLRAPAGPYRPPAPAYRPPSTQIRTAASSRPAASARPAMSPVDQARAKAGQVVTIGPLSFSPGALTSCQGKCSVPMRDATGKSITAMFFQASPFYSILQTKSSGVFVSGRVVGGGSSILLQSVR